MRRTVYPQGRADGALTCCRLPVCACVMAFTIPFAIVTAPEISLQMCWFQTEQDEWTSPVCHAAAIRPRSGEEAE